MISMVALWTALFAAATSVRDVSVVPADDRTEVVIEVDGPVTVQDFTLSNPARLVIDLSGARQTLSRSRFGDVNRGGIRAVRVGQFRPEVVRIVLDLAEPVQYTVRQEHGQIRISFPNPGGSFDVWRAVGGDLPVTIRTGAAELPRLDDEPVERPAPVEPNRSRTALSAPAPRATRAAAPADTVLPQPRITIYFKETPITDVVATFSEFSGRSIVMGQGVAGSINADIRDQPWDVALEALLQANGLSAQENEFGIIRVDKLENLREQEKVEELVTLPFAVRFANVDSLKPAIEGLLSDRGKITRNSATNTLVVTDTRSIIESRIAPMVDQLDVRTPQVTIAAKIIFVDRTALEELGIVYDLKDTEGNQLNQVTPGLVDTDGDGIPEATEDNWVRFGGSSIAGLANANARVASPAVQLLTSLDLGRFQLINFIDVLASLSVTDIQASPVITTLDNREASVQVGEETPIRVVDVGAQGGSGVPPRANVQMKNTGIILRVTPHVTGNQVLLDLHAERSNLAAAPSDIGFTFQKQESKTQVLVDNGETAVIGGLTIVEKSKVKVGIPVLMDIPVLGALFRTTSDRETKKDLLIMVTPTIIRASGS